jgi:hypothetical protein
MSRLIQYIYDLIEYYTIEYYTSVPHNSKDLFYGKINGCKRIINKSAYLSD